MRFWYKCQRTIVAGTSMSFRCTRRIGLRNGLGDFKIGDCMAAWLHGVMAWHGSACRRRGSESSRYKQRQSLFLSRHVTSKNRHTYVILYEHSTCPNIKHPFKMRTLFIPTEESRNKHANRNIELTPKFPYVYCTLYTPRCRHYSPILLLETVRRYKGRR